MNFESNWQRKKWEKMQMINERGVVLDSTDIKRIIKEYYEQLCTY